MSHFQKSRRSTQSWDNRPGCPSLSRRSERGSLIVTAAMAAGVISIIVAGMLTYISNEYAFNLRSHRWTQALHLAESGIETAFSEFNNYHLTGSNAFSSSRGWYDLGSGYYWKPTTSITNAAGEVPGTYWAYVYGVNTPNPYLFAYGTCATTPRGPIIYRAVECRIAMNSQFPAAMVAKNYLNMNGNNVTTDSFDSTNPSKSTSYLYDPSKRQPNGDVASNNTITNTLDVSVGNANIYGSVMVSPNGSVTMGPNGSIGPTFVSGDRADTVAEAQNAGWVRNDFQVDVPDVTLPAGATSWSSLGTVNNDTTISGGDFQISSIGIAGNKVLTITGDVRLYVTGDISVSGNALINITPGSSLKVYCAGSSVSISGNAVVNQTGQAINSRFYGLPSSTSWNLNGNGQWIGTVYAPQANMTMNGGGTDGHMSGAIVANNITLNGQVIFHYDEMLRTNGPGSSYNIVSWKSYRYSGTSWISD